MLNDIVKPLGLIGLIIMTLVVAAIMLSFGSTANTQIAETSGCGWVSAAQSSEGAYFNKTTGICENNSGGRYQSSTINVSLDAARGFASYSGFQSSIFLLAVVATIIALLVVVLKSMTDMT